MATDEIRIEQIIQSTTYGTPAPQPPATLTDAERAELVAALNKSISGPYVTEAKELPASLHHAVERILTARSAFHREVIGLADNRIAVLKQELAAQGALLESAADTLHQYALERSGQAVEHFERAANMVRDLSLPASEALAAHTKPLVEALAFAVSVIKCKERWTSADDERVSKLLARYAAQSGEPR